MNLARHNDSVMVTDDLVYDAVVTAPNFNTTFYRCVSTEQFL